MAPMRTRVWVVVLLLIGTSASPQSFSGFQVVSIAPPEPLFMEVEKALEVPLTLHIRSGYHINSSRPAEDYLIPTELNWNAGTLPLASIDYPAGKNINYSFSDKPLSVYSDEVRIVSTFHAPATLQSSSKAITGNLRYQACNEKTCFPPKTIAVTVPLLY